jgi:hypothetical protein
MENETLSDVDVQSAMLTEFGSALRTVGAQLSRAAQLRRRLGAADRAVFDSATCGLIRRIALAARIPLAALEGSVIR